MNTAEKRKYQEEHLARKLKIREVYKCLTPESVKVQAIFHKLIGQLEEVTEE